MAIELHHLQPEHDDELSRLKARIASLEARNHDIEEERRWRKFSEEKPNEKQWILVYYPNHSNFTSGVEVRRWDNGCKYDVELQEMYEKWMPLPSAQKEER